MRIFAKYYKLLFKVQLKRFETWLSVAMILAVTGIFFCLNIPTSENFKVLVYCEDSRFVADFVADINATGSIYFFESAKSENDLKQAVVSGTAECGFVIDAEYKSAFKKKVQADTVTYYCSSFTTKGEVAKETFYAELLKIQSDIFLEESLGKIYEEPVGGINDIKNLQQELLSGDGLFSINECYIEPEGTADNNSLLGSNKGRTNPESGTIALIIFALIYMVVGDSKAKEKSGYPAILNKSEKMFFAFARTLSAATIPVAVGFFAMSFFDSRSPLKVFVMTVLLIAYGFVFCYVIAASLRKAESYYSGLLVLVFASAVMCPIYIDFSVYVPVLNYICRIFPVGFFLNMWR